MGKLSEFLEELHNLYVLLVFEVDEVGEFIVLVRKLLRVLGCVTGSRVFLVMIVLEKRFWSPLRNYLFLSSSLASSGRVNWSTLGAGIEG